MHNNNDTLNNSSPINCINRKMLFVVNIACAITEVLLDNLKPIMSKNAAIPIVNIEFKMKHARIILMSPSFGILKKIFSFPLHTYVTGSSVTRQNHTGVNVPDITFPAQGI